jgi:hypothetical protein
MLKYSLIHSNFSSDGIEGESDSKLESSLVSSVILFLSTHDIKNWQLSTQLGMHK